MTTQLLSRRFVILAAAVGLAVIAAVIPLRMKVHAQELGVSCLRVVHAYVPSPEEETGFDADFVAVDPANTSTYVVEYRLLSYDTGDPLTDWVPGIESPYDGDETGIYEYVYDTHYEDFDDNLVQWRITTNLHSGIDVNTLETMRSIDGGSPTYLLSPLSLSETCPVEMSPRAVISYENAD